MLSPDAVTERKQNGESFSQAELEFIVNGCTDGTISDNEMIRWLSSVYTQGMSHEETMFYTQAMLNSGTRLDFSNMPGYVIDKHSTGGVGDKVSLILGPLLASCGCYVPMLAGRGLGHTQGTIDKLETISGYHTSLNLQKFQEIVDDVGISIMAQTTDICPADNKIYALRDISDTVASLPLICGSIMSKKIAEGIQGLILDIKIGNGAFMNTLSDAKELGNLLMEVGAHYGLQITTCYTDMNQPLGNTAGLWCEIMESIECMKGNGQDDLMSVVFHLGLEALKLAGINNPEERLREALSDGSALDTFIKMVDAHGGDLESLDNPETNQPLFRKEIRANIDGYVTSMNTLILGKAVVNLGGGRLYKGDVLDPTVGIIFHKKLGDLVYNGEPLLEYFCSDKDKFEGGTLYFKDAIKLKAELPAENRLIYQ